MGVLDDMAQEARLIVSKLKVSIVSDQKVFLGRQSKIETDFDDLIERLTNKTTSVNAGLDTVHDESETLVADIKSATKKIQTQISDVDGMVSGLQTTISNIQKTTDFDELDASSKQMLMDFSKEYKSAYAILWAKIILVAFLLYSLRVDWKLIIVAYLAVYISWALIEALIKIFQNMFKRKKVSDLKADRCANVTAADAVGSGCPPPAPPEYKPCSSTDFGCCANGLASTVDKSACQTIDCWKTAFGCCSNGSPKTSATDTCDVPVECKNSRYGCCLNGMPRDDEAGTNCTLHTMCGYSAFGCCPDGTLRKDALGSNCGGKQAEKSSLHQLNSIATSAKPMNIPTPAQSMSPPNPFTAKNGSFNTSFTSGLQSIS